jgi:hypothetical protein
VALRNNSARAANNHAATAGATNLNNMVKLVLICNEVYAEGMALCDGDPEKVDRLDLAQWALVAVERFAPAAPLRREFADAFFKQFMEWRDEDRAATGVGRA